MICYNEMSRLILCLLALTATVGAQLNCNSQLRLRYPEYFTHCDCHYSDWSDWEVEPQSTVNVPTWQCSSGVAYNETRVQDATGYQCEDRTETQQVCMPDTEDRLILLFGLGSVGQDYSSTGGGGGGGKDPIITASSYVPNKPVQTGGGGGGAGVATYSISSNSIPLSQSVQTGGGGAKYSISSNSKPLSQPSSPYISSSKPSTPQNVQTPGLNSKCENNRRVCHDYTESRGKRSLQTERHVKQLREHQNSRGIQKGDVVPEPLAEAPQQFNWEEHHMRFRRQNSIYPTKECYPDDFHHILFLLDTSGSIRESNFKKITTALSLLVELSCKPVKVAVMTFNHEFNLEFCFDCYDNDCRGRKSAAEAIESIDYRGGWTHTGGATACAHKVLLKEGCGLDPSANCISVVYITDGKSNDPTLRVCDEVKDLRNRFGVTTYAIGIQNFNEDELKCITETSETSIFRFRDFEAFEHAISNSEGRLFTDSYKYQCINPKNPVDGKADNPATCKDRK